MNEQTRLADRIVPPTWPQPNICSTCSDWKDDGGCGSCAAYELMLPRGQTLVPVVPITWYERPSAMRDRITIYKTGHASAERATGQLAAMVAAWFKDHWREVIDRFGTPDAVVPITSTRHEHPLSTLLQMSEVPLLEPNGLQVHAKTIRHTLSPGNFRVDPACVGKTIMLVDDVYASGATAQSAAAAVRLCGGECSLIVPVARRVNPEIVPELRGIVDGLKHMPPDTVRALFTQPSCRSAVPDASCLCV